MRKNCTPVREAQGLKQRSQQFDSHVVLCHRQPIWEYNLQLVKRKIQYALSIPLRQTWTLDGHALPSCPGTIIGQSHDLFKVTSWFH